MEHLTCKSCGGSVQRVGNFYVCDYCANRWQIDSADDVHAVDRANAWAALRDGDFEKAVSLFENIILKDGKNHEAYWGRALANAGIVYVTDLSENKKVPTCNNITEASFLNDADAKKAISLAPEEIADSYRKQAEQIERIRKEWLEKASKEPAYDVFISFKDSDREHGIERTQDSIDAQDLYNLLVNEGYKVFFSRISLHDKIAEQYEPYIYNALRTAKVMIVFGEKPEYFSAVWVKNEWSRFKARVEKGEKHKNSLVVVYKNMEPAGLPAVLKSRQCMNAASMSFSTDLMRHIRRVVEESRGAEHLDKISVTGGQIAKVASTIRTQTLQTRDIGAGAVTETSISEQQSLSLIRTYLKQSSWGQAEKLAEDLLFDNPSLGEAIWDRLLAQSQAQNAKALVSGAKNGLSEQARSAIENALDCAGKSFSEPLLAELYAACCSGTEQAADDVLSVILSFSFKERKDRMAQVFDAVTANAQYKPFVRLLGALEPSAVKEYIERNLAFAERSLQHAPECYDRVLSVDAGNPAALRGRLSVALANGASEEETVQDFEALLKYSPDVNAEVIRTLQSLYTAPPTAADAAFAKQAVRYHTAGIGAMKNELLNFAYALRRAGQYQDAEYFLKLLLTADKNNAVAYREMLLAKAGAADPDKLEECGTMIDSLPEFNKYLSFVNEAEREKWIGLAARQREKRLSYCEEQCKIAEADLKEAKKNRRRKVLIIPAAIGSIALIIGFIRLLGNLRSFGMWLLCPVLLVGAFLLGRLAVLGLLDGIAAKELKQKKDAFAEAQKNHTDAQKLAGKK